MSRKIDSFECPIQSDGNRKERREVDLSGKMDVFQWSIRRFNHSGEGNLPINKFRREGTKNESRGDKRKGYSEKRLP